MCFVLTSILCVSTIFAESLVSLAWVSHASFAKKAKERVNLELFRNVLVHEFYRLKALITSEQNN